LQILSWLLLFSWQPANAPAAPPQREATRSPHGALSIPCENCHTATAWKPIRATPEFDHNKTKYPLRGMHEKVGCTQCHVKPVFTDVGKNCEDCHLDVHQRKMGTNCAQCHTVQGWNIAVQQVKDHQNRFPLLGAHAAAQCDDCHKSAAVGQFQGLSTACISCHQADLNRTQTIGGNVPNHISANFPQTCETCHTFDSWFGATFNHDTTGFLLRDSHQIAPAGKVNACTDCHIGGNYSLKIAQTDCGNPQCHLSSNYGGGWQGSTNPKHAAAPNVFPIASCSTCHNTVSFLNATFDHSSTGFPLQNSHQMAPAGKVNACTDCHTNNNYNLTTLPTDCGNAGCHLNTNYGGGWQGATNPNHAAAPAVFPIASCSTCHNTVSFLNATFDHSTTGFPLTNSHQLAPAGKVNACTDCHINNNYTLTMGPTDCGNGQCHLNTNYGGGWQGTNNPVHSSAGAPFAAANCANCHNTVSFLTATFDHSTTGWPLVGSHQMAPAGKANACTDCHVNNNYTFTSANTDCYGCHQAAWTSTPTFGGNVPNHITAGFPTSLCSQCHDTIVWTDSTFNHANTGFPLTNSHQTAPAGKVTGCDQCHVGNYTSLAIQPTDCGNAGCHLTTNYGGGWQGTNNPVHKTAGTPFAATNCANCHNTISFLTATFDHSTTGFPLTGSHQLAPAGKVNLCSDCHTGNNYAAGFPPMDCGNSGCHLKDWNNTPTYGGNVPNHITAAFPMSMCSTCHDTVLWTDGKFDHSTTGFPLQGPHMLPPRTGVTGAVGPMVNACTDCHIGGNYTTGYPSTDCYSCHQTYYTNAQNYGTGTPNHITANYPTTCISCHTTYVTTAWLGAVFNHTYFRIPHNGSVCTDCHTNAADYKIFSCEACHTSPNAHRAGMSHPNVCTPSPACWFNPPTRCYDCHKG
jgi:hypothetical protein